MWRCRSGAPSAPFCKGPGPYRGPASNVLERPYSVGGGGVTPRPPPPPSTPPLPMFEADSQIFASAPSVPRGFKHRNFRPAFGGDHWGTLGGGGAQPNPPPPFTSPPPPPPPPPPPSASDGPEQGASTTRNRFGGCLPWGRCDPDGAAVPLPYQVLHTRSRGECDVLWQTSPVSIPADLVLWSSGSALTSCIMSRTVHRRLCASAAAARCGTCSDCHCLRVSTDTPLTALRGARHAPRSGPWNDMVCVCVRECGPEAPDVTPTRVPKECGYGNFTRRLGLGQWWFAWLRVQRAAACGTSR